MIITIKGDSQDIDYRELSTYMRNFNLHKTIDININGLKYKGTITTISYSNGSRWDRTKIIELNVITITEQIKDLYIGVNEDEI